WHELLTTDPEAAKKFYQTATGWTTQLFADAGMPYTMWLAGETPVGGLMDLPKNLRDMHVPPHWLTYIGTPNVDDTLAKAVKLGAQQMVPAMDIPTVGRFAVLGDPQGAVFAIFTPAPNSRPMQDPPMGGFSWHELVTTDYEKGFDFYSTLFGWVKTTAMDMGEMGVYQMFGRSSNEPMGGIYNKPKDMPAPPNWLPYVLIADINKGAESVKSKGGTIMHGPIEVPTGDWIVMAMDPQGAAFALHQRKK
ncbi:MAG: VOC family protein, partial [Gemmatimonadota bacterium]|nr:VOC family protein [Gemmatimonadota bacterium]